MGKSEVCILGPEGWRYSETRELGLYFTEEGGYGKSKMLGQDVEPPKLKVSRLDED